MNKIETGGPAFPCDWDYIGSSREAANGMTLRDYFAAMVINGSLEACSTKQRAAEEAYSVADAMMQARKQ